MTATRTIKTNSTILLGDGMGGFSVSSSLTGSGALAVEDFNRDGMPDLATVRHQSAFNFSISLGDGMGGFARGAVLSVGTPLIPNSGPNAVVTGDFNLDGKPDAATANGRALNAPTNNVTILLGDGAGGKRSRTSPV